MFKRLANHVSLAIRPAATDREQAPSETATNQLIAMGFSKADVQRALQLNHGNVEQAAEALLASATADSYHSRVDGQTKAQRSMAAASRPEAKIPKRLSQHEDQKEVLVRSARRIAPHAMAVDTLLKSLRRLQMEPHNPKFRTINTSTPQFQRSLGVPGVLAYLRALNYRSSNSNLKVLELKYVDPAALYLGISILEEVQRENVDYEESKAGIMFEKQIQHDLQLSNLDKNEAFKCEQYEKKLPSLPQMAGGHITVEMGSVKLSRKFDGDDTLEDVLNWLGSNASVIPSKLLQQEWFLVNRNHAGARGYNCQQLRAKTLQYIGCWPSGKLQIVPLLPKSGPVTSSSRGLGAAPMEVLDF